MEFIPFFLLLVAATVFSAIFNKFHLPWVLALIVAGIVIGPFGFGFLEVNPTIDFMAQIGLIFLMFMAGLETKLSTFRESGKAVVGFAFINGFVPLAVGTGIAVFLGFSPIASVLLGIIFMSSSVAVVVPTLEALGIIETKLGRTLVSATMLEDIASLVLLSIVLQTIDPVTPLPLPSFYLLVGLAIVGFRYALPRLRALVPRRRDQKDLFESEVRVIFAMLLGTVVVFEALGLHPIIAGFLSGLLLSDSIKSELLLEKLRTISYGIFIPIFFVVVGARTDISVFAAGAAEILLIALVVGGSILSKLGSGILGARLAGYRGYEAVFSGAATIPQLSTTLAVVFSAAELGILRDNLVTAMVILSMLTTVISPVLLRFIYERQLKRAPAGA